MGTLKFEGHLADQILAGEKTCTWRLWDDKNLEVDQIIALIRRPEMTVFATAIILRLSRKTMGEILDEDLVGHELVGKPDEMYATYSGYYQQEVTPETSLTVIHFKVIKTHSLA